ncbi:hypothetical protein KVV02_005624, partial [Mortierella alpina]
QHHQAGEYSPVNYPLPTNPTEHGSSSKRPSKPAQSVHPFDTTESKSGKSKKPKRIKNPGHEEDLIVMDDEFYAVKAKRKRANASQLSVLNAAFERSYFPSTEERLRLSKQCRMCPRTVQIWFQNKRQSVKARSEAMEAGAGGDASGRQDSDELTREERQGSGSSSSDGQKRSIDDDNGGGAGGGDESESGRRQARHLSSQESGGKRRSSGMNGTITPSEAVMSALHIQLDGRSVDYFSRKRRATIAKMEQGEQQKQKQQQQQQQEKEEPFKSEDHYHVLHHTAMTLRRRTVASLPSLPIAAGPSTARSRRYKPLNLLSLPFEILVGQILAIVDLAELGSLSRVCRDLRQLCETDYLWQRKFFHDFAFRPHRTLRQLGSWKRLYQAMDRVEVYTWGSNGDCRLGYGRTPKKVYESVPKRVRRLDGMGIVQLAPTGWGCHALDRHGNVWAWGRIMESNGIRSDAKPRMLKWPRQVTQLVAGRQVVLAMDADGQVWQWCRENKACEVTFSGSESIRWSSSSGTLPATTTTTSTTNSSSRATDDPVVQLAAGWDICAALTRSGKIFAWRPPQSADGRYQYRIHVGHSVCLKGQGVTGYEASVMDGDAFVQMAVGSDYIVAVTSLEKVYLFRTLDSPHDHHHHQETAHSLLSPLLALQKQDQDEQQPQPCEDRIVIETMVEGSLQERVVEIRGRILGAGLPLPIFSEALTHTITESYEENDQRERRRRHCRQQLQQHQQQQSSSSHPTTVSANFEQFAIHHSSGKVLLGRHDVQADSRPTIMERLVSNAFQVEFGDHHQGLLTEDGQLRTWGAFCEGALGHGDLRAACPVPTVVEGPLKNKFVIRIGMAGWHSACLAIDMSEEKAFGSQSFEGHSSLWLGQGSSNIAKTNAKDDMVDDGYHSLEHSSASGNNSNGSSSDGVDSSDGEERMLHR